MTAQRFLRWLGADWTSKELAIKFSVEPSTIRRWRRGAAVPKGEHARAIQTFQEYMRATRQIEMLDESDAVGRESRLKLTRARHVAERLERERAEAMRPVEMLASRLNG